MIYLLYSTYSHGWLSKTANYTSDYREAKQFTREQAIAMRDRQKVQAGYNVIPVRLEDLQ